MRAFDQKQNQPGWRASFDLRRSSTAASAAGHEVYAIPRSRSTIGDQAAQRSLRAGAEDLEVAPGTTATTGFAHDFSRIPVFAKAPVKVQPKLRINTPGDTYEREADRIAGQIVRAAESQAGGRRAAPVSPTTATSAGRGYGPEAVPEEAALDLVQQALRDPGSPLDPPSRSFMEERFGHDFSRVRVHTGAKAASAAYAVNARAFTVGRDVVFDTGAFRPETPEGKNLLAHELTHVVQQGGGREAGGLVASRSGERVARQTGPAKGQPRRVTKRRVLGTEDWGRTLVQIHLVGHASPRWRSARSASEADRRNAELSEARAQAVHAAVEQLVREALPDHDLVFRYDYTPADPREASGSVALGTESRGSRETLREAGLRGRQASDPSMRRVDVAIDLSSFADITQTQEIEETRLEPAATRDWAVKVGMTAQVQVGAGVGYIVFKLKNRKTKQEATGHAWFSKGGASVGGKLEFISAVGGTVDWGDYTNFTTNEPANFSDFDFINFYIRTHGVSAGVIGYESAKLTFFDLPGGDVWGIDVGGWNSGKIGVDLASLSYGALVLEEAPKGMYEVKSERTEVEQFESSSFEQHAHRVTFPTGESTIRPDEQEKLRIYVHNALRNYQEGTIY